MEYDFDKVIARRNTGSLKWDIAEDELPLWVADMDFATAPAIRKAVEKRAAHGIFGYSILPEAWYRAYMEWWEKRHHFSIQKEWLIFTTGVVPAISTAVRRLTAPAENVLVQTPCYNIFFNSIRNNGRNIVQSPLDYENGTYSVNWEKLEKNLSDPQTTLMILCNPQNPTGVIWDRETLQRIGELCHRYGVTVLSDEIHCDLTEPGKEYIPFASVSENNRRISVTCISPTKAFNLAGLQTAAVVAPDEKLRHKMWRALNTDEVAEPNAFAVDAAVAAFTESEEWLDALRAYLWENKSYAEEYLKREVPQIGVISGEATYLMWLDCTEIAGDARAFYKFLRREKKVFLSDGGQFGDNGRGFLRLNVACPRSILEQGLKRFRQGAEEWKSDRIQ